MGNGHKPGREARKQPGWMRPGERRRQMMLAASNGERITVMLEGVSEAVEKGTTAQKLVAMHGINATTIYVNNRPAWPNHHLRNGDVVNCRKTKES